MTGLSRLDLAVIVIYLNCGLNWMRIRGKLGAGEEVVDLLTAGGRISEVTPADPARPADLGGADVRLAPGLIDVQINGYDGVDWNEAGASVGEIAAAVRALWRTGVAALCPTVITGAPDHITLCLKTLARAADEVPGVGQAMLGIHLEGPFISPEDGPRGAHPGEHVRPPDWDLFQGWQEAAGGRIRILTLAPEWPGAVKFIERAAAAGVIVALGHTAARPEEVRAAVRAGARLSTHLGNGSHARIDRHPNYIWEQLAADELWASFIVDGHHLPPEVVKCFLRCKTGARSLLVTDAIAAAGRPPGAYRLGGAAVEVTPQGRVCLPGTPYLAGSVLEMDTAVGNTVRFSDATLGEALEMATSQPARLLGVEADRGLIAAGRAADVLLFDWDEAAAGLGVRAMVINGEIVYRRDEH